MSEEGVLFLGAVAEVLTKNILSFLGSEAYEERIKTHAQEAANQYVKRVDPFLIQNPKRCSKCKFENDYNANNVVISYKNESVKAK
jgi:predicted Zn-ribbon and HTH transcriptional regulator